MVKDLIIGKENVVVDHGRQTKYEALSGIHNPWPAVVLFMSGGFWPYATPWGQV